MNELSASEALYAFAGWLTSRPQQTIMSNTDDAPHVAELVGEFCRSQALAEPREGWEKALKRYPD